MKKKFLLAVAMTIVSIICITGCGQESVEGDWYSIESDASKCDIISFADDNTVTSPSSAFGDIAKPYTFIEGKLKFRGDEYIVEEVEGCRVLRKTNSSQYSWCDDVEKVEAIYKENEKISKQEEEEYQKQQEARLKKELKFYRENIVGEYEYKPLYENEDCSVSLSLQSDNSYIFNEKYGDEAMKDWNRNLKGTYKIDENDEGSVSIYFEGIDENDDGILTSEMGLDGFSDDSKGVICFGDFEKK